MDTLIEKLGGADEIAKYINRGVSLQTIAKKNGIKRFGPATEKKVLNFYEQFYNSDDIIQKIKAKYINVNIGDNDSAYERVLPLLEKFKTEIDRVIYLLDDIICGDWYKEDIMNSVIDIISIGGDEIYTRDNLNEIFNIENDPLILKKYIPGINLNKIDNIALDNEWWVKESQVRYDCYSLDFIQKLCEDKGHVYFTKSDMDDFFRKQKNFDKVSLKSIKNSLERLVYDGYIFEKLLNDNEECCYFYKEYYDKEVEILDIIEKMKSITYPGLNLNKSDYKKKLNIEDITDEQVSANNGISENCISFLDGAGGTGKTGKCIKSICDLLCINLSEEDDSTKVIFTAPTHAAKKNGKASIKNEKNINYNVLHSLLYSYYNEEREEELNNLLSILRKNETEYLAVDETSMVDMPMFHELLITIDRYLNEGGDIRVVFMGDGNQLEPIGIGNPYISLLNKVPRFTLTKNFRSNEKIIDFCDVILNKGPKGKDWKMNTKFQKKYKDVIHFDFTTHETQWKSCLEKRLLELKERGFKPYEGEEGEEKNKTFQAICPWNYQNSNNISKDICIAIRRIFKGNDSKEVFEIGDVVIMNQNVKGLFYNNDLGRIVDIDEIDGYEIELFETYPKPKGSKEEKEGYKHKGHRINVTSGKRVRIPITFKKDIYSNMFIKPNYSRTVHAVQGLQFPEILYVVPKQGGNFINIKMNYTAYSRAKDKLYLIGNKDAFDGYHSKNPSPAKNTILPFEGELIDSINETLNGKSYTRIFQNSQTESSLCISKSLKYSVWDRDNEGIDGECRDCKKKITIKQFYISPINPDERYESSNLKCVCSKCFNKFEM